MTAANRFADATALRLHRRSPLPNSITHTERKALSDIIEESRQSHDLPTQELLGVPRVLEAAWEEYQNTLAIKEELATQEAKAAEVSRVRLQKNK